MRFAAALVATFAVALPALAAEPSHRFVALTTTGESFAMFIDVASISGRATRRELDLLLVRKGNVGPQDASHLLMRVVVDCRRNNSISTAGQVFDREGRPLMGTAGTMGQLGRLDEEAYRHICGSKGSAARGLRTFPTATAAASWVRQIEL